MSTRNYLMEMEEVLRRGRGRVIITANPSRAVYNCVPNNHGGVNVYAAATGKFETAMSMPEWEEWAGVMEEVRS